MTDENVLPVKDENVSICDCGFVAHPNMGDSIQRPVHELHHSHHTCSTPTWTITVMDEFEGNFEAKCGHAGCPV